LGQPAEKVRSLPDTASASRKDQKRDMTFGNLAEHRDLRPLFGKLSSEENERLLNRLLALDARLSHLAERATRHVGVPYGILGLGHVIRLDGSSAGIHGGPSGEAGDIWFDISPDEDRTPDVTPSRWFVVSRIVVFCCDSPEPRGDANTHDLVCLRGTGDSPNAVIDILELHVSTIETELERHSPEQFTRARHAELP
jgi:hypothetical protein